MIWDDVIIARVLIAAPDAPYMYSIPLPYRISVFSETMFSPRMGRMVHLPPCAFAWRNSGAVGLRQPDCWALPWRPYSRMALSHSFRRCSESRIATAHSSPCSSGAFPGIRRATIFLGAHAEGRGCVVRFGCWGR